MSYEAASQAENEARPSLSGVQTIQMSCDPPQSRYVPVQSSSVGSLSLGVASVVSNGFAPNDATTASAHSSPPAASHTPSEHDEPGKCVPPNASH